MFTTQTATQLVQNVVNLIFYFFLLHILNIFIMDIRHLFTTFARRSMLAVVRIVLSLSLFFSGFFIRVLQNRDQFL